MKFTKAKLKQIIKEELTEILGLAGGTPGAPLRPGTPPSISGYEDIERSAAESDCGAPPSDDHGLWAWAECKCRDVGTNPKDPAYIKCMEEWMDAEDLRQAQGYEDLGY